MRLLIFRLLGLSLFAFTLNGCSYDYQLKAVAIEGKLAFIVDPTSNRQPKCINGIIVDVDDGETARAEAVSGDDAGLVENGAFWWKSMEPDCQNPFPIFYGQALEGQRMVYEGIPGPNRGKPSSIVEAKPLKRGVVYSVSTTSGATGYGGCYFRVTHDGHVESWSYDPTPTKVDKDGYAIRGKYVPPPAQASSTVR